MQFALGFALCRPCRDAPSRISWARLVVIESALAGLLIDLTRPLAVCPSARKPRGDDESFCPYCDGGRAGRVASAVGVPLASQQQSARRPTRSAPRISDTRDTAGRAGAGVRAAVASGGRGNQMAAPTRNAARPAAAPRAMGWTRPQPVRRPRTRAKDDIGIAAVIADGVPQTGDGAVQDSADRAAADLQLHVHCARREPTPATADPCA